MRKAKNLFLYGSKGTSISLNALMSAADINERKHPFEGIYSENMERRFRELESNTVREELGKYMSHHELH